VDSMTNREDRNVFGTLLTVGGALTAFFIFSMVSANAAVDSMVESATIDRIKPFGEVNIGTVPVAAASTSAPSASGDGKATYGSSCAACHASGVAGSPKLGDKGAWKARIAQGESTLFDHAINGFKGMPAKGGNASLSDDAVKAAVKYMVDASK